MKRILDRLRSRGWENARCAARNLLFHDYGLLYRDRVFGTFGELVEAYPTRGNVFTGARVAILLKTGHGAAYRLPLSEARQATQLEVGEWMLGQLATLRVETGTLRK